MTTKLLFFMTLFSITIPVMTQNVTIPDSNLKSVLVNDVLINTNGDTEIQVSEATSYTGFLALNRKSISDPTGIEAFINATGLNFNDNSLTGTLDLSQNTKLVSLGVADNTLTSLNCASLSTLYSVNASNNQLTLLDVSGAVQLESLTLNNNQFTSLSFPSNSALRVVYLLNNNLITLDVTANTALEQLGIEDNSITTIDLSNNTELIHFQADRNDLTAIDVSNNTKLTILKVSYNNITSINVTQNPLLDQVEAVQNQLTVLNLANGSNNSNPLIVGAELNPDLSCIQSDSGILPGKTNNWRTDSGVTISDNCNYPCIVNIPDANFKAALLDHGIGITGAFISTIDTNSDGEIQCVEAAAYNGTINVFGQNITNLEGIEAFTNIVRLFCGVNSLTSLDVSNNTALETLNCKYNQLTVLDVSNNLLLSYIDAQWNQLINLDLSTNINLSTIIAVTNQLTTFNIANTNNSNMITVDVRGNTNLNCAQHDTNYDPATNTQSWRKDATTSWSANCSTLSTQDNELNISIAIYPNPVTSTLNIDTSSTINTVEVYSILGKKVLSTNTKAVDVSNLSPGIHFLKVFSDDGNQSTLKFIKQ